MPLYDLVIGPVGTLRVADHFTVGEGKVTRIRQVLDTAPERVVPESWHAGSPLKPVMVWCHPCGRCHQPLTRMCLPRVQPAGTGSGWHSRIILTRPLKLSTTSRAPQPSPRPRPG